MAIKSFSVLGTKINLDIECATVIKAEHGFDIRSSPKGIIDNHVVMGTKTTHFTTLWAKYDNAKYDEPITDSSGLLKATEGHRLTIAKESNSNSIVAVSNHDTGITFFPNKNLSTLFGIAKARLWVFIITAILISLFFFVGVILDELFDDRGLVYYIIMSLVGLASLFLIFRVWGKDLERKEHNEKYDKIIMSEIQRLTNEVSSE